jgi:hypothetical protein
VYNAVDERTARLAPKSVSHFVFSKRICLAVRASPHRNAPKTLKMGWRESVVTTQENTVSCAIEGYMRAKKRGVV